MDVTAGRDVFAGEIVAVEISGEVLEILHDVVTSGKKQIVKRSSANRVRRRIHIFYCLSYKFIIPVCLYDAGNGKSPFNQCSRLFSSTMSHSKNWRRGVRKFYLRIPAVLQK